MPTDAPPFSLWMQPVIPVAGKAVAEEPATETPIIKTEGKVTTSSTSYQTLATWTVTALHSGILRSLEMAASSYTKSRFQITIGGSVKFTDLELPDAATALMAESRLSAGVVVLIEGKSSDGTQVDLWGMIEGKEVA